MARAAVFVLSSAWEGFSNVLAEALACGCPVVSTDCPGGSAEILRDGAYGPLVPVGDADALAEAMVGVLQRPPERDALRARARSFSVERAAEQYLRVLHACAMRGRQAAGDPPRRASLGEPSSWRWEGQLRG
jgi:glycosyltransferase involved in cell wall biosynthesis